MNRATFIAVNRFGFGAGPKDGAAARGDPRGWLRDQLRRPAPAPEQFRELLPTALGLLEFPKMTREIFGEGQAKPMERREQGEEMVRALEARFRDRYLPQLIREVAARFGLATAGDAPLQERLTWFWANHFTVSALKPQIWNVAGSFEREAIRPHLGGRFVDLLLAATKHPSMIVYLDNHLSVRPTRRAAATDDASYVPPTGFNENLAREILELHTLGVEGGYAQEDVTTFARALTGWTVGSQGEFTFDSRHHDRGTKSVLGRSYVDVGRDGGLEQCEAILRDLAAHPATATHVATKLVRHFVADDPPRTAVARIATAFRESEGDLPTVHAAVIDLPEAWQEPLPKLKSPCEFLASCLRTLHGVVEVDAQTIFITAEDMGQAPFFAPSPQGWPDRAQAWAASGPLWKRVQFAQLLADRAPADLDPAALAEASYGEALSAATRSALAQAGDFRQGLALWLASPEFQRR